MKQCEITDANGAGRQGRNQGAREDQTELWTKTMTQKNQNITIKDKLFCLFTLLHHLTFIFLLHNTESLKQESTFASLNKGGWCKKVWIYKEQMDAGA